LIEAAALVLAVGFTSAAAYIVGSRTATNTVLERAENELVPAAAKDVIEELLVNPDTSYLMKRVVRDYAQGRRLSLTGGFKGEKVGGKMVITSTADEPAVLESTPIDEPVVIDSVVEKLRTQDSWDEFMHPKEPLRMDTVWVKKTPTGYVRLSDEDYQTLRSRHGLQPMPVEWFKDEVDEDGNPLPHGTS
jgi:hypothetical protein